MTALREKLPRARGDSPDFRRIAPGTPDRGSLGLTLVELLLVLIVIAVLASAAISLLSSGQKQLAAEEAVQRLVTDLTFVQADAAANRSERHVVFDENAESYSVYAGATLLWHPVSKRPYTVDLESYFPGAGLELGTADFGGSDTLRFDPHGVPVAGGQILLTGPGAQWTIRVAAGTGCVTTSGG